MQVTTIRTAFFAIALGALATTGFAATTAGVPMKDYHAKLECKTCHEAAVPTDRPSDKACIACHGTMDKIPTKPNKFDKFPHASAHYGNTLECTTCHAQHKESKALCNDCHVVEWTNFR